MKKGLLICLMLLMCALLSKAEDLTAAYKEKYEESVAFKAVKTLARYLSDDLSLDQAVMSFEKNTTAWDYMKNFDGGWFSSVKSRSYTDFRTENWVVKSETEFSCDAYMLLTINFSTNNVVYEFPCGFHFDFRRTNAEKDFWQAYDFYCLPDSTDMETAAQITEEYEGITAYAVVGKSYKGFMLIVDDPSRMFVGTIDWFGSSAEGLRINKLTEKWDALGAINGGGFADTGGKGNGGTPYGLIISNGVTKRAHESGSALCSTIMGFDNDNVLHVGNYTYAELQELELRDAMAFHPALIIDGETVSNNEGRLYTIRTAIGQDADGRVLLLAVKGRQPDSLGAALTDLAEVMHDFGAVNAGNLDGGSSTCMYLGGKSVYSGYWPDCSRRLPCAFMIRK